MYYTDHILEDTEISEYHKERKNSSLTIREKEDYVIAFKSGNKLVAEQLLSHIPQPAVVMTTFRFKSQVNAMVSVLHLAAYWGWRNIVTALVSVYKCAANCKDEEGHVPLHYAAYSGHLEVVKYLITEPLSDPMDMNMYNETPLHIACENGHLNIAKLLIKEKHCNPSCEDNDGNTPLHYACRNGQLKIARFLIRELNCSPSCEDNNGNTPLHYACRNGHLKIARFLIRELNCSPSCEDNNGNTPLHYACRNGHLNIAQFLIRELNCSPSREDNDGNAPLHYACRNGHLNIAQFLIRELNCNPSCEDNDGNTPLHRACRNGHLNIAQFLIRELNCNPSCEDNDGNTPLHCACLNGHLNIAQFLIRELNCNPSCEDNDGNTPLHYACRNGRLKIAQYLLREEHCNPSCENNDGSTPLHYACTINDAHIVQYLLSTGKVNPLAEDKYGDTAFSYASDEYIIKLFQQFKECRKAIPVHTFTKVILTGDSGAGKTTIAELIVRLGSSTDIECVTDVQHLTAGIVPHHMDNFVMYDFAGQQEYYSSHSGVLEQVMRRSAAMFLCIVDLSESKEKICESLHYWLSFIDNACSKAEGRSHVLIVGSHADQVSSSEEEIKSILLKEKAVERINQHEYAGYLSIDCRKADTDASHNLFAILINSQKAIAASQPVLHYYSHIVYAFLRTKLTVVGCTLHDLFTAIAKENNFSLPNDQSVLIDILTTLSDRGLILFIHHPHSSWVIVKTEVLLNKINRTLFAPRHFKEHRDILASNTGIVPVSSLHKVFPDYNSEMLIGFLTSLNFCQPVDPSVLQYSNLQTTSSHSTADLLFFPGLVQSERPDSLVQHGALEFGWCLGCVDPHEFFSSRFLHALLLSVAYKFPLASQDLYRMCTLWRNGIFWRNIDNTITTVIELLDNNRWVLVAMSCDDTSSVEHAELRSSLIALVRHLQQHYSPCLNVYEFLISPDLIQQYPLDNLLDSDLFDIHHVARSMLLSKSVVPSYKDSSGRLPVQSLPIEPYHQLSFSSVCQLLNPVMADQPVPAPLLDEVRKLYRHFKVDSLVYKELRKHLDRLSLFVGRNPLVSSVAVYCICSM